MLHRKVEKTIHSSRMFPNKKTFNQRCLHKRFRCDFRRLRFQISRVRWYLFIFMNNILYLILWLWNAMNPWQQSAIAFYVRIRTCAELLLPWAIKIIVQTMQKSLMIQTGDLNWRRQNRTKNCLFNFLTFSGQVEKNVAIFQPGFLCWSNFWNSLLWGILFSIKVRILCV